MVCLLPKNLKRAKQMSYFYLYLTSIDIFFFKLKVEYYCYILFSIIILVMSIKHDRITLVNSACQKCCLTLYTTCYRRCADRCIKQCEFVTARDLYATNCSRLAIYSIHLIKGTVGKGVTLFIKSQVTSLHQIVI